MAESKSSKGVAQKLLPYTTILLIAAGLYVAWTFYSRWRDNRAAEEAVAAKKAAQNKKVVDQVFGSGEVKLLNFSILLLPVNGGLPVAHSYNVTPNENRSLRGSIGMPFSCSGDM